MVWVPGVLVYPVPSGPGFVFTRPLTALLRVPHVPGCTAAPPASRSFRCIQDRKRLLFYDGL